VAAGDKVLLNYRIEPLDLSVPQATWQIRVTTAEGVTLLVPVGIAVQARAAQLSGPDKIQDGMIRGQTRIIDFVLTNTGAADTGPITFSLPEAPWLQLAHPGPLASLAPGAWVAWSRCCVTMYLKQRLPRQCDSPRRATRS